MDKITCFVNLLYEKYPYPSLPIKTERDLCGKLHTNVMSKILATIEMQPHLLTGKEILDAGCGTGEKSCYFAYYGAAVEAFDLCCSSLSKGKELAKRLRLEVDFKRCNIFDFTTKKRFDHIFCLGVLHHTSNPYTGFCRLAAHCKKGGTITIGLYNRYGRFLHRIKRLWIRLNAGEDIDRRMAYVERTIYGRTFKNQHEEVYAADKYANVYESYHSIGEILDWFNRNDFKYIGSFPHTDTGQFQSFYTQMKWLMARKGFFIISGRKN